MIHEQLHQFDAQIRETQHGLVCGVDEAGRGPLAGPVCCAAVLLDPSQRYDYLTDSKKLTPAQRERLYSLILNSCVGYQITFVDNETIDTINILQATMRGMRQAIETLEPAPALALIDGNRAPETYISCNTVVRGDATSASIAAASVLAKVARDRFMVKLDARFPAYGFAQHKGYPTKQHFEAIAKYGITPFHRRSFLKHVVTV